MGRDKNGTKEDTTEKRSGGVQKNAGKKMSKILNNKVLRSYNYFFLRGTDKAFGSSSQQALVMK